MAWYILNEFGEQWPIVPYNDTAVSVDEYSVLKYSNDEELFTDCISREKFRLGFVKETFELSGFPYVILKLGWYQVIGYMNDNPKDNWMYIHGSNRWSVSYFYVERTFK